MTQKTGSGQFQPADGASEFNATSFLVRQMMARLRTAVPVVVKAVTPGAGTPPVAGTVDVQPLVSMLDGNGNATPHGTIYGRPWVRIQGGKNAIILEPEVGDIGVLLVADRDISSVVSSKAVATPGSLRMFDLADGIYLGGFIDAAPTQYLEFLAGGVSLVDKNGNKIEMTSTGVKITPKSGQSATVDGPLIVTGTSDLKGSVHAEGTMTVDGELDALKLKIGGGATITRVHSGTIVTPLNSMASGSSFSFTGTATGALVGDLVLLGAPGGQDSLLTVQAYVSSTNTVTITIGNPSAGTRTAVALTYAVLVLGTT